MPLPTPQSGETRDNFVRRNSETDELKEQFPDEGQRRGILERIFKEVEGFEVSERKIIEFELKDVDEKRGTFAGYGSTFGNVDLGNDRVIAGAFTDTLKEFKAKKQLPAMFWLHDWKQPVGEWESMKEDKKGLAVKGALWVDGNQLGRKPIEVSEQVRNLLTSNGPKGLSIGYGVKKFSFEEEDRTLVRNLEKLTLFEVSPVPFGMNPEATVTVAKGFRRFVGELPTKRELEVILRDGGLSGKGAKALISGGFAALSRDEDAEIMEALKSLVQTVSQ